MFTQSTKYSDNCLTQRMAPLLDKVTFKIKIHTNLLLQSR